MYLSSDWLNSTHSFSLWKYNMLVFFTLHYHVNQVCVVACMTLVRLCGYNPIICFETLAHHSYSVIYLNIRCKQKKTHTRWKTMAAPLLLLRCMFSMKPRTFETHVKFGRYLEVRVFTVSPIVCTCMQIIVEREESTGVSDICFKGKTIFNKRKYMTKHSNVF